MPHSRLDITKLFDRLSWGLLAALAAVVVLTFRHYGVAWDEPVQHVYGGMALNYYLTLGADTTSFRYINLHWYGALFDMLIALAVKVSPLWEYDTRHLLSGLIGVAGVAGTWRLGRALGGPRAGFFAALLLALTPVWHGAAFINPKDIPFAAALACAALFLVRIARALPQWRWRDFAGFALAAGPALGIRVGGLIALAYLAATLGMHTVLSLLDREDFASVARRLARLVAPAFVAVALALLIMYLAWPWAQSKPIAGPVEAFRSFARFPIQFDFPFFGRIINSTAVPWYYEPAMMAVMLPELAVAAVGAAAVLALAALRRRPAGGWKATLPYLVLAMLILFPLTFAPLEGAVLFDGMRHMLFVVPPIMAAAALALERLARAGAWGRGAATALAVVTAANQAVLMARSHPYQYLVYNSFVGGTTGAEGRFELDYWGLAFREAVEAMHTRLVEEGEAPTRARQWRVTVCGPEQSAALFFPPDYVLVPWQDIARSDFFLSNTRYQCRPGETLRSTPVFVEVRRFGALLARIYDLRAAPGRATSP